MTSRWLLRLVRRHVGSPLLYGFLRSGLLVFQWATRRPDEPDLLFLSRIPQRQDELILDIGANGGQSAVALSFIRPRAKILSFEPVPALWPELARLKRLLGHRFEFRGYGLGTAPGRFPLYIPISGHLPITTRASTSIDAAKANCAELERATGLPGRIDRTEVEIRQGDAEGLVPLAIKIDVEGTEFEVVRGLQRTIAQHRPLVILERSKSFENCADLFLGLGYDVLTGDSTAPNERRLEGLSNRNWIACPREMTDHILGTGPL